MGKERPFRPQSIVLAALAALSLSAAAIAVDTPTADQPTGISDATETDGVQMASMVRSTQRLGTCKLLGAVTRRGTRPSRCPRPKSPPALPPQTPSPTITLPPVTTPATTVAPAPTTAPSTTPASTTPPATPPATTAPRSTTPPAVAAPTTTSPATTTTAPAAQPPAEPAFDSTPFLLTGGAVPASSASEPSGNFRFMCNVSHLSYDDPIVYPGKPGAAHLHMFFGNTLANANSTYDSLRSSGDGTCAGGPVNRSAYWAPAVVTNTGQAVLPDFSMIYYKGTFSSAEEIAGIGALPAGLKMIAGYNMAKPTNPTGYYWYCENTPVTPSQTIVQCPTGEHIIVRLEFPACWDGVNLDSADHRSHMSYVNYDPNTGKGHCPATHPVHIPEYTIAIWFPNDGTSAGWHLSSDEMPGMTHASGSTFHADWFGAWDPQVESVWVRECINMLRNCNAGEIGDGRRLSGAFTYPEKLHGGPTLVAPPAKP